MDAQSELDFKMKVVSDFIEKHKELPEQGSQKWLDNRKYTIGGSEIAVIEGTNPYQSIKDLFKTKLGINPFRGNVATNWGKIFENVVVLFLERLFECSIYETGSVPGCIPYTSYSPDGICTCSTEVIMSLIEKNWIPEHELMAEEAVIVLFEIKSPYARIPDGKIPSHYKSQPKAGLCHLPFIDISYFVDTMIRKCTIAELKTSGYDTEYHNDFRIKDPECVSQHLACGIIGIYTEESYEPIDETEVLDYGMVNQCVFNDALEKIASGTLKAEYFPPSLLVPDNWVNMFMKFCDKEDKKIVGVIPYKIFMCEIIPVYREPNYIQNISREINEFFRILDDINNTCKTKDEMLQKMSDLRL